MIHVGTWVPCVDDVSTAGEKLATSSQVTHFPSKASLNFFDGAIKNHGCTLCFFVPVTTLYELFEPVSCRWIAWKR